jgi:hypothetical protein
VIFKYGSYAHSLNEVMLRTSVQGIFDKFNRRMGSTVEWTILGVKQVADQATPALTQAALTTALGTMETAYQSDYQNAILYLPDGTTATQHQLLNAGTFGGVKVVVPPSYVNGPWTGRIEYLNRRTYFIVLRAEFRTGTGYYSWKERLMIKGNGGAKWRLSPQEVGVPQYQVLQTATRFLYVQQGESIGRATYVTPSAVLFPSVEHGDERELHYETPDDMRYGSSPEMYPLAWKYVMESATVQTFAGFVLPTL